MSADPTVAVPHPPLRGRRIAIVYDCFFPNTVGGAERWYRALAETLRDGGAEVTYLTRKQWSDDQPPDVAGVAVIAVSPASSLYDANGRRRVRPGLRFGFDVARYLARHRRSFDLVQVANFPFWSVIGARIGLAGTPTLLTVDWHEIWSRDFWTQYAGRAVGTAGFAVQRLCIALSPATVVTNAENGRRLKHAGARRDPLVTAGQLPAGGHGRDQPAAAADPPFLFFAGRHIYDKGVDLLLDVLVLARRRVPDLRLVIASDGPLRDSLEKEIAARNLSDVTSLVGFVDEAELTRLGETAVCTLVPSRREGYGLMVVESAGRGTPVVTAGFPENLATAHMVDGTNGFVARPPTVEMLAAAVVAVVDAGLPLRESTLAWYKEHAPTKTADRALRQVMEFHAARLVG